jgi:hypothetical protein
MLNDLFGHISFLGHDPDLPGSDPVSHSSWVKFARAGQMLNDELFYTLYEARVIVKVVPTLQYPTTA